MKFASKILLPFLLGSIALTSFAQPIKSTNSKDDVWLSVSNSWTKPIYVKEGVFFPSDDPVYAGGNYSRYMVTSQINNLRVSYDDSGVKRLVPGCPTGNFNSSLRIVVHRSNWDANTPVCEMF